MHHPRPAAGHGQSLSLPLVSNGSRPPILVPDVETGNRKRSEEWEGGQPGLASSCGEGGGGGGLILPAETPHGTKIYLMGKQFE